MRVIFAIMASTVLWFATTLTAAGTGELHRILPLSIDIVSLDVPAGLEVRRKLQIEHGEFVVRRSTGSIVMHIVVDNALREEQLGESRESYCVNGLVGTARLLHGWRQVLIAIPPVTRDYTFFFQYREADATAVKIMKTLRVKDVTARCA